MDGQTMERSDSWMFGQWVTACPLTVMVRDNREKIEDYLRFLTHAEETRFTIFACRSLGKLGHFVNMMGLMLTFTLKIV